MAAPEGAISHRSRAVANQRLDGCKQGSTSSLAGQSDGGDDVFHAYAVLGIFMICDRPIYTYHSARCVGNLSNSFDAIPLHPEVHLICLPCILHLAYQHAEGQIPHRLAIYQIRVIHGHRCS